MFPYPLCRRIFLIAYLIFTVKQLVWNKVKKHNASSCWNARLVFSTETVGVKLGRRLCAWKRLRVRELWDGLWEISSSTDSPSCLTVFTTSCLGSLRVCKQLIMSSQLFMSSRCSLFGTLLLSWAKTCVVNNESAEILTSFEKLASDTDFKYFVSGSAINKYSESPM